MYNKRQMRFTNKSKYLLKFFKENQIIKNNDDKNRNTMNKNTLQIIYKLYYNLYEAYSFLILLKKNNNYPIPIIKKITSKNEIIMPKTFSYNSFPVKIRNHINETTKIEILYSFSLFERSYQIYFIDSSSSSSSSSSASLKKEYNNYIDNIIIWLYILNMYSSVKCAETLTVYIYLTNLEKQLPSSNITILDQEHINTAFTYSCVKNAEIVIFRKEEWFKVFIHETFHTFGLDFSDMNNEHCHSHILSIFKVNSDVNLFESYTEFWAEIINVLFCSFHLIQNKKNINDFFKYVNILINFERNNSFYQLIKILKFMGLTYQDLYSNTSYSKSLRETLFKENTSILSYYVIKTILLFHYQDFLLWCSKYNISLFQFKKTRENQKEFCKFIEKHYKYSKFLEIVNKTDKLITKMNHSNKSNKLNHLNPLNHLNQNYIINNLRMTVCELE